MNHASRAPFPFGVSCRIHLRSERTGLCTVLFEKRREEHVLLEPWKPLNHDLTHSQLSPTKATGESFHCLQALFLSASRRPQCSLCRRQVLSGIDVDSVDCCFDCSVYESCVYDILPGELTRCTSAQSEGLQLAVRRAASSSPAIASTCRRTMTFGSPMSSGT